MGKEGIHTGAKFLTKVAAGQDVKSSLKEESQQGLKNLIDRVYEKRKKGEGRKRSIKGPKKVKNTKLSKVGPPKKLDYLGSY